MAAWPRLAVSGEVLRLVTLDYPPYEYRDESSIQGLAVNVVREVFRRLDREIEIVSYPWARSLKMVELGEADAIFTAYRTPERERYLDYSNEVLMPQAVSLFALKSFVLPEKATLPDLSALADYRFGVRIGVSYGAAFDKAVEDGTLTRVYHVGDGDAVAKMLASGRVDLVPFNRLGGYYLFRKLGLAHQVRELTPPLQSVPSYIAFSKKRGHAELRDRVDEVLRAMKTDGSYTRLTAYGLVE